MRTIKKVPQNSKESKGLKEQSFNKTSVKVTVAKQQPECDCQHPRHASEQSGAHSH